MVDSSPIQELLSTLPQVGHVAWMGVRPSRDEPMVELERLEMNFGTGLEGDHFKGSSKSTRQVTLIQQEHLEVIASCLHREIISPMEVRRNIVVAGINLLALKNKTFSIGSAVLECTGLCHPCSQMELRLGEGGYNAMRGHGGITSRIVQSGLVRIGDEVTFITSNEVSS